MSDLDLDIKHYSIYDLEKFFKLKKKYSESDVEYNEYEIRQQLLSSGHVQPRFKKDLIDFLNKAKEWLLYSKFGKERNVNSIPKDWKSDPLDVPRSITKDSSLIGRQEELATHQNASYVHSSHSNFYAGTLNPLNTRVISKYITIDTRFRENLTSKTSDFTIQLPTRLNKVVSMQLSAMEMPITFYGISATYGNNYLYISVSQQFYQDGPITQNQVVVVIPDGNYDATELIKTINRLLAPIDEFGELLDPDNVFSFIRLRLDMGTNDSGSGKVTIEPAYNTILGDSISCLGLDFGKGIDGMADNSDITTKIGWNLGFISKIYCGSPFYTGDVPVTTNSLKYVYLAISDYQHNVNKLFLSAHHSTNLNDDILARISVKSPSFTVMMGDNYTLITEPRIYFGPVDISKLRIQLFDDHGRLLSMNQTDYSFVLLFKMVYDL
jgi:hypothetical protein